MVTSAKSDSAATALTSELKEFIDGAVVPALLKQWLAENGRQNPLASKSVDVDNSPRMLSAEEGVTL